MLRAGTVVDATLIAAPSSTKNAHGERDPEMNQSKKGNQWYFGIKAHIGVDVDSGMVHTVRGTTWTQGLAFCPKIESASSKQTELGSILLLFAVFL